MTTLSLSAAMSKPSKGDTSAVSNSNVVWTSLIAYVVLKENLHWLDWLAIPLTIGIYSINSTLILFASWNILLRPADFYFWRF